MSMNIMQKIFSVAMLGGSAGFIGYMYFKKPAIQKQDAFNVRQRLLQSDDVKILYSTMSLFYLQGFQSKSLDSFYKLYDILRIDAPRIIAMPISRDEYYEKYLKVMAHPKFKQAMENFQFNLRTKNEEEIKKMTTFDLKNLQHLMLIDKCHKLKRCKLVFCRKSKQHYQKLADSYDKVRQQGKASSEVDPNTAKIQDFTDILIAEMKQVRTFSILPEPPFKTIIGVVEPQIMRGVAKRWKEKFKQKYNHNVIEDQEVLEREAVRREVEGKSV